MPSAVPCVAMRKRTVLAIIGTAAVLAVGCGGTDDTNTAATTTTTTTTAAAAPAASSTEAPATTAAPATTQANTPKISLDEFNQLQTGMSYEQAVAIIGGEGEKLSESTFGDVTTVMYSWEGSNDSGFGANANAMFQNDALVSKSQLGLK